MAYFEAPFAGPPPPAAIEATVKWLGEAPTPILAYCRSGTRSATVWALAQAKRKAMSTKDILEAAAEVGYDLSGARAVLEALSKA
jgi:sulfide:quinone oxidoreductase